MKPFSVLVGTLFLVVAASARAAEKTRPPNIVFILADDLGYGDLGCYNKDSKIPTPNLDRLAAQGMRFTDAHTPSAVCTPTRYGLLTGRYCWRTSLKKGVLQRLLADADRAGPSDAGALLKQHGYNTACIGKWHLGLGDDEQTDFAKPLRPGPITVGFDYFFGIPASLDMPPYVFVENEKVTEAPTAKIEASEMRRKGGDGFWRGGAIAPGFKHVDVLPAADRTRPSNSIQKQTAEKPFFLYFPLTAPHTPWMPTKEFQGKSGAGWYGDFVVQVDARVGRVLQTLDEAKLADNTLVDLYQRQRRPLVAGRHREVEASGQRRLRGQKADIWDGGHRVPFMARWPGKVTPGQRQQGIICLTDLLATTADLLGDEIAEDAGEDSFDSCRCCWARSATGRCARRWCITPATARSPSGKGRGSWRWRLGSHGFSDARNIVPSRARRKGQLYNLDDDPAEQNNLWLKKPKMVERLTQMLEKIKAEWAERGDVKGVRHTRLVARCGDLALPPGERCDNRYHTSGLPPRPSRPVALLEEAIPVTSRNRRSARLSLETLEDRCTPDGGVDPRPQPLDHRHRRRRHRDGLQHDGQQRPLHPGDRAERHRRRQDARRSRSRPCRAGTSSSSATRATTSFTNRSSLLVVAHEGDGNDMFTSTTAGFFYGGKGDDSRRFQGRLRHGRRQGRVRQRHDLRGHRHQLPRRRGRREHHLRERHLRRQLHQRRGRRRQDLRRRQAVRTSSTAARATT